MDEPVLARLQHLMQLREEVEQLSEQSVWSPSADWYDHAMQLELCVDLPDVSQDSLEISYDETAVHIIGERSSEPTAIYRERPMGSFSRSLSFPQEVQYQSAVATLAAGVLRIHFDKKWPTIDAEDVEAK